MTRFDDAGGGNESGSLAAAALEASLDGIIIIDAVGTVSGVNAAATRLFGWERDELIGRNVNVLMPNPWRNAHDGYLARYARSSEPRIIGLGREVLGLHRSGTTFPMHLSVAGFDAHGEQMYVGFCHDLTERDRLRADKTYLADHDALTGCLNRRAFQERLGELLSGAEHAGMGVALFYIDLDDFKTVNDSFGHAVGDELISQICVRLMESVGSAGTVGRLGGDEFAISLVVGAEPDSVDAARRVAEKFTAALDRPFSVGGLQLSAAASCGIALFPADGTRSEELLRRADIAMYSAKNGTERIRTYDQTTLRQFDRDRLLLLDVSAPQGAERLLIHYQPLVDLRTGSPIAVEALLRMRGPDGELMLPSEFLPTFVRSKHLGLLTRAVLTAIGRDHARCAGGFADDLRVCVNVPASVLEDEEFPELILSTLAAAGLPASCVEIEITESERAASLEALRRNAAFLREQGFTLSLDDFGTGYSSLELVRELPLSRIKLDRSFVANLSALRQREIIASTARLAEHIGLELVVEGIETETQRAAILGLGCAQGQGYLFGAPMRLEELLASNPSFVDRRTAM